MSLLLWISGIVLFIIVISIISSYLGRIKCPKCGKRNCDEINRKETARNQVMFEEEEIIKHVDKNEALYGSAQEAYAKLKSDFGRQDSTTIRKYKVPGERIYYEVTYKCNDCSESFTGEVYVDKRLPTVKG